MQSPRIAKDNEVLAAQRRGSEELTEGLEDEIEELHVLSTRKRAFEMSCFALIYVVGASIASIADGRLAIVMIGVALMGAAFNSLGILIHEGLHGVLANNPRMNHLLSFLVGLPIVISATAYQVTHTNHHYELGRNLDYGTYRQHVSRPVLIWFAYFIQLFLGTIVYMACIPFLAFKAGSRNARIFIVLEYCIIISVYRVIFAIVPPEHLLLYWGCPLVVMSVLTNVRGLASHALGDVENLYLSSRTITSSKFISFLFLHENYHLEHHIFPRVPSYNLRRVHELIWDRLPEAIYSNSYLEFLLGFLKAAFRSDLTPMGIVRPSGQASE